MLDFTNEAFNQMAFAIKMPVVFSARSSVVTTFGNDDLSACPPDFLHKRFGIISFVGNESFKNNAFNQIVRLPMVALFAARQDKADGIS